MFSEFDCDFRAWHNDNVFDYCKKSSTPTLKRPAQIKEVENFGSALVLIWLLLHTSSGPARSPWFYQAIYVSHIKERVPCREAEIGPIKINIIIW